MLLFFFCFFVLSYYMFLRSEFPCSDVRYDFRIKKCLIRLYLQLFVGWLMFYLRYLWWFAYSGVQHILCCVFIMFVFVLCLVYPMLRVSLDCQLLIAPSVFFSVYLFNGSNLTPSIESLYIANKYDINIVALCFILITDAPHPTQKSWFYLVTFIKAGSNTIRC